MLLMLACAVHPPRDLGSYPADQASLSQTEVLAHLASAAGDVEDVTALLRADGNIYTTAPDPSALFEARLAAHQALAPLPEAVELSVLTFNTALLSRTYLGNLVEMPEINARRAVMGERLFSLGYDVLLLQEVWEWSDYETLAFDAARYGYAIYGGTEALHPEHGLAIAVREALINPDVPQEQTEQQFDAQRKLEHWPGPSVRRGWLTWSFTIAGTDRVVHLYDLHATSFVDYWLQRELQARQVGMEVASHPAEDVVILGGDLNSGPYYHTDIWTEGDGTAVAGWWRNATAYALWLHYGEMYDVLNAVEIPQDVRLGSSIPGVWQDYLTEPYGQLSWCDEIAGVVFTATDCNSLYYRSYGGTEFPARLDHLMIHDPSAVVRVVDAGIVLDEVQDFAAGQFELSDHYGMAATLHIAP